MKRQALDHTKMDLLMSILRVPRYTAVGIMESLWHLTAREAPRGDIGKLSDERIAKGIGWGGDAHRLVGGILAAGWLDTHDRHRLVVHDWHEHADGAVKKYIERNKLTWACLDMSGHGEKRPDMDCLPVPVPEPIPVPAPVPAPEVGAPAPKMRVRSERWRSDREFLAFKSEYEPLGVFIDGDFAEAYEFCWRTLDPEQRMARMASVTEHASEYLANPRFTPKPLKFLESEWQRPRRPPARDSPVSAVRKTKMEEAVARFDRV